MSQSRMLLLLLDSHAEFATVRRCGIEGGTSEVGKECKRLNI